METYRGLVMAQETDSNDHLNVQFYTTRFDMATGQFMTYLGYDISEMKARNLGFAYVEMNIRFIREVFEDQAIHIETKVLDCSEKVVTIQHELKNSLSQKVHSSAIAKWLIFDKKIRKSIPLPEEVRKRITNMIEKTDE